MATQNVSSEPTAGSLAAAGVEEVATFGRKRRCKSVRSRGGGLGKAAGVATAPLTAGAPTGAGLAEAVGVAAALVASGGAATDVVGDGSVAAGDGTAVGEGGPTTSVAVAVGNGVGDVSFAPDGEVS